MYGHKSLSDDPGNSVTSNVISSTGGDEKGLIGLKLVVKQSGNQFYRKFNKRFNLTIFLLFGSASFTNFIEIFMEPGIVVSLFIFSGFR